MAHYKNNGNNGKAFQRRKPTSRNSNRRGNKRAFFRSYTENCDKSQIKATADYHAKRLKHNEPLREDDQDRAAPPALR